MSAFRRALFCASAAIACVAALLPLQNIAYSQETKNALVIGTSSVGSAQYVLGVGMSEMIRKHTGVSATVQPVGGSIPNLFALATNKTDVVISAALATQDRYLGRAPFREPYEVRVIAQGQPNYRVVVVRRGSGVKSPRDLIGQTMIGKRRAIPDMEMITNALFKVHDIDPSRVQVVDTVNTGQVVKALRAGTVAAAVYPAALRQPALMSLFQDGVVDFMDLSVDSRDKMLALLPDAFFKSVFDKGSFPSQEQDAQVFGLNTGLVVRQTMSDEQAYAITRTILANPQEFSRYHAAARDWTVANSLSNPAAPFHDGAIRYFKEVGAWNADLQAMQAKLLARQ